MAKASSKKSPTKTKKPKKAKKLKLVDLPGLAEPSASIDGGQLLAAAQPVLVLLEKDLLARAEESPGITRALKERYEQEKAAERTADSFAQWQQRIVTQVAASWLISCVFVRTLEDRGLLGTPRIAGPGAMDSQKLFFELSPSLTERDYLLTVFRELSRFPAAKDLFDPQHSLLWKLSPSANAAKELLALFRTPDAQAPAFRFGQASTRFLGDLYQDLSEDVRKRYALLQTPDFIESFILDRTLEPAIERFGLDDTTLIDPTCGSGHFLLGAFDRLFEHRQRHEPGIDARQAAHKALDQVFGADINPYAVAIARFRLTLAYLGKAGFQKISDAPELPLHLVVADSLLHNPHQKQLDFEHQENETELDDWRKAGDSKNLKMGGENVFALEDEAAAKDVLHRQYAAVVGNPPYITVKDAACRDAYRKLYSTCHRNYSLAAPFCQRFFQLGRSRGFVGQITANSFMKREFGKKLVEDYLPSVNLALIVNTSGAYIPGHGTPTVLLFGTHEEPQEREILSVLAKRGEPSTPSDPALGEVWSSVTEHWNELDFENDYISVANTERDKLGEHPWSLAGGGASELKELLESRAEKRLGDIVAGIGRTTVAGEDDLWIAPVGTWARFGLGDAAVPLVIGEVVRDWAITNHPEILYPYDEIGGEPVSSDHPLVQTLWPWRTLLGNRTVFGKQMRASGRKWWEHLEHYANKLKTPRSITFAFVATHNHFVLDRGGKVFNRSAPIIKLPADATEDDHLALLAYLNSSTACFWMKQVFAPKGMNNGSEANSTPFLQRYEFDGTKLKKLPIPAAFFGEQHQRFVGFGQRAQVLAETRAALSLVDSLSDCKTVDDLAAKYTDALERRIALLEEAVALQEEIDWLVYSCFDLAKLSTDASIGSSCRLGERPFERALVMFDSADCNDWFRWLGLPRPSLAAASESAPTVSERSQLIRANKEIRLLESPSSKRRWVQPAGKGAQYFATDDMVLREQIEDWLEEEIETFARSQSSVWSMSQHLEALLSEPVVVVACQWLSGGDAEPTKQLEELVGVKSVPFCEPYMLSESGMLKANDWKATWELQRREDRGEDCKPSVPPKFAPKDFPSGAHYTLRGKLNVPKERFISYPGCESDEDGEPVYGWAGWNHMQRAQALAALYQKRKTEEGWTASRLTPMLAGLLELIPWVKQWHNEPSDEFNGLRMGDYFEGFLDGECREHGLTNDDLEAWRPAKKTRDSTKKAKAKAKKTTSTEEKTT